MITRDTILDLAQQASSEHNHKLGDLLLTVAGMLETDGRASGLPDLNELWRDVYGCQGAFGRGLAFLCNREKLEIDRLVAEASNA